MDTRFLEGNVDVAIIAHAADCPRRQPAVFLAFSLRYNYRHGAAEALLSKALFDLNGSKPDGLGNEKVIGAYSQTKDRTLMFVLDQGHFMEPMSRLGKLDETVKLITSDTTRY